MYRATKAGHEGDGTDGNFSVGSPFPRNNLAFGECRIMDPVEEIVAPAAIERALEVYQRLKPCDKSVLLQARKIVTQHIYGLVDRGERDEQRLTVGGLARLKAVERDHVIRSARGQAP
jgi:hypothetical protein